MKPTLQLQLGQHLTMTPQLQQAIRLLQLSTLELQQEIQEALDSNPLLEVSEEGEDSSSAGESREDSPIDYAAAEEALARDTASSPEETSLDIQNNETIPDELPVDSAWDDIYSGNLLSSSGSSGSGGDEEDMGFESRNAAPETLYDHLLWQLNLTPFSDTDRAIGFAIIDAIDERGYLEASLEEILAAVVGSDTELDIELDEIEAVLHRIQQFDPPGVAARDLRECLLIQLRQLPADIRWRNEAIMLVDEHLNLLATHDYAQLMRKTKLPENALKQVIRTIQHLTPNPGSAIESSSETDYVIPDVIVRKLRGRWLVELNPDNAPRLRVNASYASMIRRADSSADNSFLKNHLQEARWFIKSLQSRNETLLKVATCIVEHQRGFLEDGPEAMKPLVLRDIAQEVEMHESTISRVTTQKYMHTPRGIFELKYFFSSHVSTTAGGEASSTAIRAMIKKLVGQEDVRKPLSDNKIAEMLEAQGIEVARRTIAKYRESLNIPPSNERKRLV